MAGLEGFAAMDLEPHEIGFHFDTQAPIPAGPFAQFVLELQRLAQSEKHFGADAMIVFVELHTGCLYGRWRITFERVNAPTGTVALAAAGALALAVKTAAETKSSLADQVTAIMVGGRGSELRLRTQDKAFHIYRKEVLTAQETEQPRAFEERLKKSTRLQEVRTDQDDKHYLSFSLAEEEQRRLLESARFGRLVRLAGSLVSAELGLEFNTRAGNLYPVVPITGLDPAVLDRALVVEARIDPVDGRLWLEIQEITAIDDLWPL